MPGISPDLSEFDWFILHAPYNAERDGRISHGDLGEAGSDAMKSAGLNIEQYGRALRRLQDAGHIVAHVLTAGEGQVVSALPERLTSLGMRYSEARIALEMEDESDHETPGGENG